MLNRSRPFGQVYGMGGVHWEQDGQLYDYSGNPVNGSGAPVEPEPVAVSSSAVAAPPRDFASRPDRELRVMMEQYGERWTTRQNALLFLNDKR
jgi:hypothetical protein